VQCLHSHDCNFDGIFDLGDSKVAKMAEDDDNASTMAFGRDKYLCIEYLPWMGREVFQSNKDTGDICCSDCHKIVGQWQWKPSFKYDFFTTY
jgi:hypothetical protein